VVLRPSIVWFRQDLRLEDNPALSAAAGRGGPVVPVYVWSPSEESPWGPGGAGRWWLHQSLRVLDEALRRRYSTRLVLREGPALEALRGVIEETGAEVVFWNMRYEPAAHRLAASVAQVLRRDGLTVQEFQGALLVEPSTLSTKAGGPFKVFTPFWRAAQQVGVPEPRPAPAKLTAPARQPASLDLAALGLEPRTDWAGGLRTAWQPGEDGALQALQRFLDDAVAGYPEDRDRPDVEGTSRLSPHLHFGEIGPRTVFHAAQRAAGLRTGPGRVRGVEAFLRQLYWREFAHYLLHHFPHTVDEPLHESFRAFPWHTDTAALRAWQHGLTGYPVVDAGMRELWATGWMHNRVRMIAASFLVKDLLLPWQDGARWFWDTLVDADLANNTLGWQWVAGCGADAAPYFRIFNPVLQGRKFDPEGGYVRHWIPELAALPTRYIHAPWEAPESVLRAAGVTLGQTYPHPVVDHGEARARALTAYAQIR
jgi:deoxyribodipyrimidine photo-lyase